MGTESRPLAGARVLITRNAERAGPLARILVERGARAVAFPVTCISAPSQTEAEELTRAFERLAANHYDWVLLTSVNAISRLFEELGKRGRDVTLLHDVRTACVGPATRAALAEKGVAIDVVAEQSNAIGLGLAVIAAAGESVSRARVLVPRAAGGRQEAVTALRDAGAEVDAITLYRSATVDPDDADIQQGMSLLRERRADVIAFFAPSQVRAAFELLGTGAAQLIGGCAVVAAIGETTKASLEKRGVAVRVVPAAPTPEALASAIAVEYARGK